MGGIADYSGSLVLQLPLAEATFAAIQLTESPEITVVTTGDLPGRSRSTTLSLENLGLPGHPLEYQEDSEFFAKDSATRWAAYIGGAFTVSALEKGARFTQGAKILIDSDVPEGKGVSSSAALEVASMNAIAYEIDLLAKELALLCQPAELQGSVALPEALTVWGLDSGIRHSVSGADYVSERLWATE